MAAGSGYLDRVKALVRLGASLTAQAPGGLVALDFAQNKFFPTRHHVLVNGEYKGVVKFLKDAMKKV